MILWRHSYAFLSTIWDIEYKISVLLCKKYTFFIHMKLLTKKNERYSSDNRIQQEMNLKIK